MTGQRYFTRSTNGQYDMKRCSISQTVRKFKFEPSRSYHDTSIKRAKIKKADNIGLAENGEEPKATHTDRSVNGVAALEACLSLS